MKKWIVSLAASFCAILSLAQTEREAKLDSLIEDVLFSDEEISKMLRSTSFHFLYATASTSDKTLWAGREIGENLANATGQVMYFNSWGLYASVAGYWYSDIEPNYTMTLASVGYSNRLKFHKNLRLRCSYDHFFYNLSRSDFEPSYFGSLGLGASYSYRWVTASFDAMSLVGNSTSLSYSASISGRLTLWKNSKIKLSTRPTITAYIASEDVAYYSETYIANEGFYYKQETGLLNTQLSLPLSFAYKNFDARLSYKLNIPRSLDILYTYEPTSALSVSVGYFFGLNRK